MRLEARVLGIADLDRRRVHKADLRAKLPHDLELQRYVNDLRHIFNPHRPIRQQRRRHDRDRRVFCARNRNLAVERFTAVDYILGQNPPTPHSLVRAAGRPQLSNTILYFMKTDAPVVHPRKISPIYFTTISDKGKPFFNFPARVSFF